jgi:hypothetical protein
LQDELTCKAFRAYMPFLFASMTRIGHFYMVLVWTTSPVLGMRRTTECSPHPDGSCHTQIHGTMSRQPRVITHHGLVVAGHTVGGQGVLR